MGRSTAVSRVTPLKFLFEVTLGRGERMAKMRHVRQPRKLRTVLGHD
jgi:hypothetical protein